MKTSCPTCGAEVEFRYDDSFVRVCGHCNAAVLRSDRGIESLGKVADLVPMESPLKLFADGHYGSATFILVGMAQIRHSAGGLWQEWYAKLDGGQWGWLAEAQGRYYLTFEQPAGQLPPQLAFQVGAKVDLPYNGQLRSFTVAELGTASYVAASGELPYKLVPQGTFRYVDLSDGQGTFATIDYGDEGDTPALYIGQQVSLADLRITGGEIGPSRDTRITATRLACPNCNASVELRLPGESQRIVCAYCNHLLDSSSGSTLAVLDKLRDKASPRIPLGSKGTFLEGEMTVIGYVSRSAYVDGTWWPFDEYLLHAPNVGFRWLVQSDGHWSYVQPIATGAVEIEVAKCVYDGVKFKKFQQSQLRVDQVLGEFYWQVQVGEQVEAQDFIAPPAMVSVEATSSEENYSLSTYMKEREVQAAFGDRELPLGNPIGVGANQPDRVKPASNALAIGFIALIVVGFVFAFAAGNKQKFETAVIVQPASAIATPILPSGNELPLDCVDYQLVVQGILACNAYPVESRDALKQATEDLTTSWTPEMSAEDRAQVAFGCKSAGQALREGAMAVGCGVPAPATGPAEQVSNVMFSEPFQLDGDNIEIELRAPGLSNNWAYAVVDLINEKTGKVVTVDGNVEYYAGYEDGESWSEGSTNTSEVIEPQGSGSYLLRVDAQHGGTGTVSLLVRVKQDVFRFRYMLYAMLVLGIPLLIFGLISWSHEKKRWENSTEGSAPHTPVSILILMIGGVFALIVVILKALAESSSDDD